MAHHFRCALRSRLEIFSAEYVRNAYQQLADKHDTRIQRNAPIQIFDIVVYKSDAPGSYKMADCLGRIGPMNDQAGLVKQQRTRTERTAGTAGRA